MEKPQAVFYGEIAIWGSLAISAIATLLSKVFGYIDFGLFVATIFVYILFCIIPYKIGQGSNAMRWFFLVLSIASVFLTIGSIGEDQGISQIDVFFGFISFLLDVFALFMLFKPESSAWFKA